ncbi:MAG: ribose 5-phosphate isomerase B [Psychrilyobacter sp.]|nr:ribose 5-phosphate isomerase B [Psychrilyobacter sp.]
MKVAIGCDHGAFELKEKVIKFLQGNGYDILDLGCNSLDSVDYPKYGKAVGEAVVNKKAEKGIVLCGTGIGISIAANKVKGVRAALCNNTTTARLTREHNDANVLAIGARMVGDVLAFEMVETFLTTEFEGGRHQKRIEMISEIEG